MEFGVATVECFFFFFVDSYKGKSFLGISRLADVVKGSLHPAQWWIQELFFLRFNK